MSDYLFKVGRWYVGKDDFQFRTGKYFNKKSGVVWSNYYPTLQQCALDVFRKDFEDGIEEHEEFSFEKIDDAIKRSEKKILKAICSM